MNVFSRLRAFLLPCGPSLAPRRLTPPAASGTIRSILTSTGLPSSERLMTQVPTCCARPHVQHRVRMVLLKRSIIGSYHQVSAKHLDAYLDKLEFRYNNRENPYMFRDAMLKLLLTETLPYKKLIADA